MHRDVKVRIQAIADRLFAEIDVDGSGGIDYAEFKQWINRNPDDLKFATDINSVDGSMSSEDPLYVSLNHSLKAVGSQIQNPTFR